jgi:hypothetical protein
MIVGWTLDYYIIYVLLLKITTKGNGKYIIFKKKNQQKNKKKDNKCNKINK